MTQTIQVNTLNKIILALKDDTRACSMLSSCKYVEDILEKGKYTQYWVDVLTGETVVVVCENIHVIQLIITVSSLPSCNSLYLS